MIKSVGKKCSRDSTTVPSHSGESSYSQQSYKVVEDMESEQSRSSSPIADNSGYNSSCDGPSDPFNISSQQNSEDADKSKYKPDKKNSKPSKSVNQLEPSYHVSNSVFYYDGFNDSDLGDDESPLRQKFNAIIKDLKESSSTSQGNIKLIKGDGNIEYFRAKLSDGDRLLFTSIEHNGKNIFVILEVILNHKYDKSKFLTNKEKIKNIKIRDQSNKEVSDNASTMEIGDAPQVRWLGKFITFSAKQEEIVKNASNLPLVISGAAGSGKTSVALESLKKIQEKFKGGKVLYITKSKNLVNESKKLFECERYDETTDELKTYIPEEIDFLFIHEFFEKVAKKDVEGKKPINRKGFFLWFNKKCEEGKFRKYAKDGDKIFEEFIAVIAGGGLGRKQYGELGDRQAIFLKEKRNNIYNLFEEYKKFIEKSSGYYDTSLIAHECIQKVQANYDAVVVDEVQDLTESVLDLILKSLKDKSNFLLCGDVNQVIHPSFFSKSRLKSFLGQNGYVKNNESEIFYTLDKNYRNSKQVIELANRVLHLKNYCFASEDKMTEKEKKLFFMESKTGNTGNVSFVAKGKEQEMAKKVSESINWAILVLNDESKEDACKLFKTPLVFNIHEAKGLEFENVILYEFTSHEAYNKIWNAECPGKGKEEIKSTIDKIRRSYEAKDVNPSRPKDKEGKSFEEHKFYMNALYVGVTRAINSVHIISNKRKYNLLQVIEPEEKGNVDIKKEESTPEEWRDMALKLIDEGNIEQAKNIAIEKLPDKKEYAEEIVDVLKAKEKDYIQESQLPLDKNEQAISELKTENPTQESLTPAEKSRKRKGQQNQNEEKKSERLEKNTKELFSALENGKLQNAKKLIKKGVDVNAKDQRDFTSLHFAVQCNYYDIVQCLLNSGANVNTQSEKNWTPLHTAARDGLEDIAELLLQHKADINAKTYDDTTPLHLAAEGGYDGIVKLLLKYEAKVNVKTHKGFTSLHLATNRGHKNVAELLLKHEKIDVNVKTQQGSTPLHATTKEDMVELLLQNGAEVNAKARDGTTPLHVMAKRGLYSVVKLLLSYGAKVDAKTEQGVTPLHMAADEGRDKIVQLLLDKKANVNAKDQKGRTPLHNAAQNGHYSVVKLLLQHEAEVNAKNSSSDTPLALALKENCNSKVVDLLLANPNINVGCIDLKFVSKEKADKRKLVQKKVQDDRLFKKVKEAAEKMKNGGELGESLKEELENLLKADGFKLGLNYSPDGGDENTTLKIAIKAGGELLQLLYDYAKKNIDKNTKIFKRLKYAKENPQPRSSFNDVTTPHNLAQAQVSTT